MLFSTQCPSCQTRFRMSELHAQAADGWARCGHCADLFDTTPSRLPLGPSETQDTDRVQVSASALALVPPERRWGAAAPPSPWVQRRSVPSEAPVEAAPVPGASPAEKIDHVDGVARMPEFVRQARRRARWRRPWVRVALSAVCVVLIGALTGQWLLHHRDRLAGTDPVLRSYLVRLCEPIGCEVGPWRHIDALHIDSAALVSTTGGRYRLDVVLSNQARQAVAVPALELSLTDSREQVIVRRVLTAPELVTDPTVPGDGQLSLSVPLEVKLEGGQTMAGYRTLIFYP